MREIKFRAWDKKRKKMWYPNNDEVDFYAIGMSGALYALDENGKYDYTEEFEKMIFMQFTGLKDSNGKEIYEGDIVSWKAEGAIGEWLVGIVKWEEDRFIVERVNSPLWVYEGITCRSYAIKGEFYAEYRIPSFEWDELEIIGNIYENPELLKEVENG